MNKRVNSASAVRANENTGRTDIHRHSLAPIDLPYSPEMQCSFEGDTQCTGSLGAVRDEKLCKWFQQVSSKSNDKFWLSKSAGEPIVSLTVLDLFGASLRESPSDPPSIAPILRYLY